jgi:hypothetical protein
LNYRSMCRPIRLKSQKQRRSEMLLMKKIKYLTLFLAITGFAFVGKLLLPFALTMANYNDIQEKFRE